jgi:hypothetical protein
MPNETAASTSGSPGAGQPELIAILRPDADIRATHDGLISPRVDTRPLQAVLDRHDAVAQPLFGLSEERLRAQLEDLGAPVVSASSGEVSGPVDPADQPGQLAVPDLAQYYQITAPADRLEELAADLRAQDLVESAYVKPAASLPQELRSQTQTQAQAQPLNDMLPDAADAPPTTANFTDRQAYLNTAPGGVDAKLAWVVPGGSGKGVRIIDCEWGWRFTHEDLLTNQGGVVAGTASTDTNHGTAVLGVISADRNGIGVTGIAPDAVISASSFNDQSSPVAIKAAADKLSAGDIILLEIHRPGPSTPSPQQGQLGFIAIEWWPDDFAAIRYAVAKGIVVVEAAGNGSQNLDAAVYNTAPTGFPAGWKNPFNPANPSSGAVLVGAGAPPPGTHGRDNGPDRSRLDFSNYGSRVDVQGWGREVTTTGYGDLQGGGNSDLWYTDTFSGTSSASPVVVGSLASVQGVLKARGTRRLNSPEARRLLRASGSPQQDAPGRPASQRIGTRPDLRALIPAAARFASRSGDFNGNGRAEILVSSPWGIGLLEQSGATMTSGTMQPNGTRFGSWLLNTGDNLLGPVADYDGDGRAEVLVTSPWGLGIWEKSGSTMATPTIAQNGTRFGGWLLNTADNSFGPAADFDGDGRAELLVTSPWGIGILKQSGSTMSAPMMAPNGTRFGGWLLNTADNTFGPVGDFDGDGRLEILVSSPWGIAVLRQNGSTLDVVMMAPNGTRFGGWLLNTADNTFGPVGDYDGDGHPEILVSSPWGVAILKLSGLTFSAPVIAANGTRFGGWLLNTADNTFGLARDFDGDGRAEILVSSPWGMGLLKQSGETLSAPTMAQNGTRFGEWLLNTADNRLGSAADYDADGMTEILVSSPWGIGILKQSGETLTAPMMAQNGTRFGGWLLNTLDNDLGHGA